jgi:flagellar biosynthesis protein FlhG
MMDQASTLRLMATVADTVTASAPDSFAASHLSDLAASKDRPGARAIAITSGKGGVGKSNVAVNVALELASLGRRVTLLDADLGLANADVLLGLNPQAHLGHVLAGKCTLPEIIIEVGDGGADGRGMRLIPGGSGVAELAGLTHEQGARLVAELRALEAESDFMIVDTAAGIAGNVTGVLRAAAEVVVVTTPDPTAVVDAYATIKVLSQQSPGKTLWVVVNDVVALGDAERVFNQLRVTASRFLNQEVKFLGAIPNDPELVEAVREQRAVVEHAPECPASRSLRLIARYLNSDSGAQHAPARTATSFWQALTNA